MELNTIFFIGPQGSGKGTQAKLLAERLGFFYWEMSGLIRKTKEKDASFGAEVQKMIDQGILLPDSMIEKIIQLFIDDIPKETGIVFDGVPRRLGQANFILNILKSHGRKNLATIFIDIPKEESLSRLLKRAQIQHRPDDTKEKIEFRLEQYAKDTLPVLDLLKNETQFFEIDGSPSVEEVMKKIYSTLGL
jgi:adenylate kinase